jgi:ABC-type Fe3+ transport system permease subunit
MNGEDTKELGLALVAIGAFFLALSIILAYLFPSSTVPTGTDLPTLLSLVWQRLVYTISAAIVGVVTILVGTVLYGFGRLIKEISYLQPVEESGEGKGGKNSKN